MAQYSLFVLKQTIMQEHALYNWASCGLVCSTKDITIFFRKKIQSSNWCQCMCHVSEWSIWSVAY